MKSLLLASLFAISGIANADAVSVSIEKPALNSVIACGEKNPDGYCYCPVKGKVSGLTQGQYICVFMKFSGGGEWWVSGNCLPAEEIVSGEWEQGYSSCGSESETGSILIKALVLSNPEKSGSLVRSLPNAHANADTRVTRR